MNRKCSGLIIMSASAVNGGEEIEDTLTREHGDGRDGIAFILG